MHILRYLRAGVFLLFLVGLISPLPAQENGEEQEEVVEIRFTGLDRYNRSQFLSLMQTTVGEPFNRDVLQEDIRRIYDRGYIEDVQISTENVSGGVRIELAVEENPPVSDIQLQGNRHLTDTDLLDEIALSPGQTIRPHQLNRAKEQIRSRYRSDGYHFVEVEDRIVEEGDRPILVLDITEGPRVTVRAFSLVGVEKIPKSQVRDPVQSRPPWLFGSTDFVENTLQQDLNRIEMVYRRNGHLDATAHVAERNFTANRRQVSITVRVEEGPQYTVSDIRFEGNQQLSREQLLEVISVRPGDPMEMDLLQQDIEAIRNRYGEDAYIDTVVNWRYEVAEEGNEITSIFEIDERGQTTAGRIEIEGNDKTQDRVIRRNIEITPGEPVTRREIQDSLRSLQETQYFQDVSLEQQEGREPGVRDFVFQVEEQSTGRIQIGGGVSSDLGIVGNFSVEQSNFDISRTPDSFSELIEGRAFAGAGQQFNLTIQPGAEQSTYSVQFREPYVMDQPIGAGARLYSNDLERDEYREERLGANFSTDYRQQDWTYQLRLEGFETRITDIDNDAVDDLQELEGRHDLFSLTPSLTLDRREPSSIRPAEGYIYSMSFQNTAGDFEFGKIRLNHRRYWTLYENIDGGKHVFSARGRAGYATSYSNTDIPLFERFFTGGSNSIRGFSYRSISPRQGNTEIGGRRMAILNFEYTFPIVSGNQRQPGDLLRGAFFSDMGSVANSFSAITDRPRVSVGAGIRFQVPGFGPVPLSLDFAFPIVEQEGDDTRVFHFNMGAAF